MGGEQRMRLLWDYYKAAAEFQGWDGRTEAQAAWETERRYGQSNFSLLWFFQRSLERLNPLSRAFLGDEAAMEALDWVEEIPEGWERFALEGPPLNDSQREAIRAALAAPLSFIQGPPGTGKTETILNLACCAARMGEGRSVAIVSSNNSALDNVRTKIERYNGSLPNKGWLQRHFARLGSAASRKEFQDTRPEEPVFQFSGGTVRVVWEDLGTLSVNRERSIRAEDFLRKYPIVTSTIHSLKNCFQNGPDYCYDYVIMDESSQTDVVAGLLAMSAARHLVLVGDSKQLPPVVTDLYAREMAAKAAEKGWTVPPEHVVAPERSFLDVCLDVFGDRTARTTLRSHYRCHPGIIGFCAREIYREEGLEICTPRWDRSVRTPIKVLWFEGDYCERCLLSEGSGGKTRRSKRNRKQERCFMEEEWPRLWERLQGPEPPSVCILSPFKGQLAAVRDAIRRDIAQRGQSAGGLELSLEGGLETAADGQVQEPPMLTIHKSQGREFDVVYLLPVEDGDWEWPWSQQKRLINVAVSRAKGELRLVLSSALMEEEIQEKLTGRPIAPRGGNAGPEEGKDQRYLQKLVRYVREENEALERETGTAGFPASTYEYGFHRSGRTSVFDRKPWSRREAAEEDGAETWSPEICVETALVELLRGMREERGVSLSLFQNVSLRDIRDENGRPPALPEGDREMRRLVEYGGHLDFVICRGERILLAVEVDGSYHRAPDREGLMQRRRDEVKDRLLGDVLGAACQVGNSRAERPPAGGAFAFVRLPDDGSTCLETRALWRQADEALRGQYVPLEEILEARLDGAEGGYHIPMKSITVLTRQWDDPEGKKGRGRRANRILTANGLVTRCMCLPLGETALVPTEKGRAWGITEGILFSEKGTLYGNAHYPETAQARVMALLAGGAGGGHAALTADMPVETILSEIFTWLDAYLRRQGGPEEQARALSRLDQSISFQTDAPDYSTQETQALYLLRYLYGYAYEYKQMYRRLLEDAGRIGERLTVVAVGCGNMADYWALRSAMDEYPKAAEGADYTGVDINSWAEAFRIQAASGDRAEFVERDAGAWLREQAAEGRAADLYVFPKSISDFDGRKTVDGPVLRGIREGLRDLLRQSSKERVWLLFSLRRSRDGGIYDVDRAKCALLRESVEEAGFRMSGEAVLPDGEASSAICRMDRSFRYPDYIIEGLRERGQEGETRLPVMTTGYMYDQILSFERGGSGA